MNLLPFAYISKLPRWESGLESDSHLFYLLRLSLANKMGSKLDSSVQLFPWVSMTSLFSLKKLISSHPGFHMMSLSTTTQVVHYCQSLHHLKNFSLLQFKLTLTLLVNDIIDEYLWDLLIS